MNGDATFAGKATSAADSEPAGELALERLDGSFELVMVVLGLIWLGIVAAELVATPPWWLEYIATGIWGIFVAEFAVRFVIATDRLRYLRTNWLTLIALVIPALRVFRVARFIRVLRAARAARGVRAARLVTTFRRARRSLHVLLAGRNALGYVIALSLSVTLLGAAAMFAFERGPSSGFESYGHSLWWTAMLLMTMGTEGWPRTVEGRILSLMLALYGFAVFGYITASLASWFVGRQRIAADIRDPMRRR